MTAGVAAAAEYIDDGGHHDLEVMVPVVAMLLNCCRCSCG